MVHHEQYSCTIVHNTFYSIHILANNSLAFPLSECIHFVLLNIIPLCYLLLVKLLFCTVKRIITLYNIASAILEQELFSLIFIIPHFPIALKPHVAKSDFNFYLDFRVKRRMGNCIIKPLAK